MELTKKDKKHIEEQVHLLTLRARDEATEYARLCELYYYECLRQKIDIEITVLKECPEMMKRVYNKDPEY